MPTSETIAATLERIGDDPDLARAELRAELRRPSPRKTLVSKLEKLAGDPDVPLGLKDSADFWRSILERYELRPDERRLLEDACRTMDLIDRLERALETSPLIETGSMGQPVASPLVSEVRQHRGTLRQLLSQLKLPDEPGSGGSRSGEMRALAMRRWGNRGS